MNAITKALASADRSYDAAKQAVGRSAERLLAGGTQGTAVGKEHFTANSDRQKLEALKSWTWVAVRAIANRVAAEPYAAGRLRRGFRIGSKSLEEFDEIESLPDHPALTLLRDPSNIMTGQAHLWLTVASLCLTGRSLWWVTRIGDEQHILYIPVSWLTGHIGTTGYEGFTIRPPGGGEKYTLPADECVLFSQPDPADPWKSVSPLSAVVDSINIDHDLQRSQRSTFSRGIFPHAAVVVGKQPIHGVAGGLRPHLTPSQRNQIVTAIRKQFESPERAGGVVVLDGLVERVDRLSMLPTEMAYGELSKDARDRILMSFGVSPYNVGGSEPGSRAASAVADAHFCRNVCRPIVSLINNTLQEWFLPIVAAKDERLRIWLQSPEPEDAEMRLQRMTLAAQSGVMTAHELRSFAGLPADERWDGVLVGGQNLNESALVQRGLENLVTRLVAESRVARDEFDPTRGNGRVQASRR